MSRPDSEFIDVEVVSPGGKNQEPVNNLQADPFFALVARLMDNFFQIPGTNIRFGLDPLIGLIPGMGDASGAVISAMLIWRGARAGLPRIVLARMALNVLLNSLVGTIPFFGDLFSVWFKSNQLNYALYQANLAEPNLSRKTDWIFVISLILLLLLAVSLILTISLSLLAALWKLAWAK